jgi:Family of unknown function (DUF6151)
VKNAAPETVNRLVCYCDDCQAFMHYLGRADLLDAHAGSDIVQVAPASLTFDRGGQRIAGMRLSPKGLFRWYATCCNTPLGNTLTPSLPFVGIIAQAFVNPDDVFGKPVGAVQGKFAIGDLPEDARKVNVRLIARAIRKVLGWRLRGKSWPHPYFDRAMRAPRHPVTTVSREDREALRKLCGPTPTARAAG